jgi:CBS-domain-containing membrane protein
MFSPARRLILLYALVNLVTLPYAAIADDLSVTGGGTVLRLVLYSLLVWRLWKGSLNAWCIAVILEVLMVAFLFLLQPPFGATPLVVLTTSFGALMILFSPSVLEHTRPHAKTGLASG